MTKWSQKINDVIALLLYATLLVTFGQVRTYIHFVALHCIVFLFSISLATIGASIRDVLNICDTLMQHVGFFPNFSFFHNSSSNNVAIRMVYG